MKGKKLPLIIIGVVVLAAIGVVLYMFVFSGEDKGPPFVYTEYAPGDFFILNAKPEDDGSGARALLKTTVVLVLNTDTLSEEALPLKQGAIRDTITGLLRNKTEAELRVADLTGLKKEICDAVNERLEIDNIIDILFTDFVVQ